MALMSYKCPNCGGGLQFDPPSQKFKCEFCLSEFTKEEMKRLEEEEARKKARYETEPGEQESAKDQAEAVIYSCPSCGAEIVTDATTPATFCYYCHNPVVLSGKLSGEFMPDYVLPFAVDKKGATEKFLSWIEKKKFVPKSFYSKDQIEKLSGIYFPYLPGGRKAQCRCRKEPNLDHRKYPVYGA